MKEELNRTINVLQTLTNRVINIKQKSNQCLNQIQYNQLTGRIANIEQLFKQKVKTGILSVKLAEGPAPNHFKINNSNPYTLWSTGLYKDGYEYQFIQFEYPLTITGYCDLPTKQDYFRIVDQDGNILHEKTGGNNYTFTIQDGPDILYIECECFD